MRRGALLARFLPAAGTARLRGGFETRGVRAISASASPNEC